MEGRRRPADVGVSAGCVRWWRAHFAEPFAGRLAEEAAKILIWS